MLAAVALVAEPSSLACIVMRKSGVQTPSTVEVPTEARRPYMKSRVKAVRKTAGRVAVCADCPELAGKNVAF